MAENRPLRWWASPRSVLRHILLLDDSPHAIALGVSIGVFIGLTPTIGLQMFLVMLFAVATYRLFYFNRPAALFTVYISNPITALPIYWFNYKVGTLFVDGDLTPEALAAAIQFQGLKEWWAAIREVFVEIGWPLLLGSLIVGIVSAVISYPVIWWLVHKCQDPPTPRPPAAEPKQELSAAAR